MLSQSSSEAARCKTRGAGSDTGICLKKIIETEECKLPECHCLLPLTPYSHCVCTKQQDNLTVFSREWIQDEITNLIRKPCKQWNRYARIQTHRHASHAFILHVIRLSFRLRSSQYHTIMTANDTKNVESPPPPPPNLSLAWVTNSSTVARVSAVIDLVWPKRLKPPPPVPGTVCLGSQLVLPSAACVSFQTT